MIAGEFSAALTTLGWSHRELARRLRCDTNLSLRWAAGRATIPPQIAAWMTRRTRDLTNDPAPDDWRVLGRRATTPEEPSFQNKS